MNRPAAPHGPDRATGTIYKLVDPRDGTIRYIGQTLRTLKNRHKEHLTKNKTPGIWLWVKELEKAGMQPAILAVETDVLADDLDAREQAQIRAHLEQGCPLLNHPHAYNGEHITDLFTRPPATPPDPARLPEPSGYAKWLRARRLRFQIVAFRANLVLALAVIVAGLVIGRPWEGVVIGFGIALATPFATSDERAVLGGYVRGGLIVGGWITVWTGESLVVTGAALQGSSAWYIVGTVLVILTCLGVRHSVVRGVDLSKPIEQADLDPETGVPRAATEPTA